MRATTPCLYADDNDMAERELSMLLSGGEETRAGGQIGGGGRRGLLEEGRVVCSLSKGKDKECGTDRGGLAGELERADNILLILFLAAI